MENQNQESFVLIADAKTGNLSVCRNGAYGKITWELPQKGVLVEIAAMPSEMRECLMENATIPLIQTAYTIIGSLSVGGLEGMTQIDNLRKAIGQVANDALAMIQDLAANTESPKYLQ